MEGGTFHPTVAGAIVDKQELVAPVTGCQRLQEKLCVRKCAGDSGVTSGLQWSFLPVKPHASFPTCLSVSGHGSQTHTVLNPTWALGGSLQNHVVLGICMAKGARAGPQGLGHSVGGAVAETGIGEDSVGWTIV